ncbi:MAG: hypothetical protein ACFHWX_10325 [Bacteroidota bacterium]
MQEVIYGLKLRKGKGPLSIYPCHWWFSLFLLLFSYLAAAQSLQCKKVPPNTLYQLDTIPVENSSIHLSIETPFSFNPETNEINIVGNYKESVEVCYRKLNVLALDSMYDRDIRTYSEVTNNAPILSRLPLEEQQIFEFNDVESFGAITRGVTFGNRQNLYVNSALNLQMEGKLSEDLNISAVITDQNIPYQPEGNTQQLRDFDNVFIKLYNDNFNITAGDIVLQNPVEESYFLKYYKNVQGLSAAYNHTVGEHWKVSSRVSGSAAKGQFASTVVKPIESVQGPYKLRGPNNERFIIILANSEKVYIDGKLMERGFDRDYVIDYNLGEVTFSNNVVITRFTRIRIDFEYAEQFYNRSNITANQVFSNENLKLYFNYYRESDNPNSSLGITLSDDDYKSLSSSAGGAGIINGADSTGFIESLNLYERKDTLDQEGNVQQIYLHTSDPQYAVWNVSFTEVGFGNGDYILVTRNANGKIYKWVSRLNGIRQGNYDPIINIPTPNKKEVAVAGSVVQLSDHEKVYQEIAISNRDQNLYSEQNMNNIGYAWKGGIESQRPIGFMEEYTFRGRLTYEFDHKNFKPIDRFRTIEYDRNWGYDVFADSLNRSDQIGEVALSITKNHNNTYTYQLTTRDRSDVVNGTQQSFDFSNTLGFLQIRSENFMLKNEVGERTAKWIRTSNDIHVQTWKLNPGYMFTIDRQSISVGDSAVNTLMNYHSHNFYLQSADSSKAKIRFDYIRRFDQLPQFGEFRSYTAAEEVRFGIGGQLSTNQKITGQLNYRSVTDHFTNAHDENVMGRFEWISSYFQNNIKQQVSFTSANTQELKRDFVFVPVPTGQGTHTWRDDNRDGKKDLNEFYEAFNMDERNYIKLFTPTDEYVRAFQTTYQHSLDARFPSKWKDSGVILSEISKLSFNGNIRANFKTTKGDPSKRLNPFVVDLSSQDYIFARNQNRYSLFYNRNAPGLGFDINRVSSESKSLLSSGYELRRKNSWDSNVRIGLGQTYILRFNGSIGEIINQADFVQNRNFQLFSRTYSPEVVIQPGKQLRVTADWERRQKEDQLDESGVFSSINEFGLLFTWLRQGRGSLNANIQWVDIEFEGEENSYLGYELLEALKPGSNQKWTINWQQSLGKGLQLNLQYFGRKSAENRAIHTGTAQLTAYF